MQTALLWEVTCWSSSTTMPPRQAGHWPWHPDNQGLCLSPCRELPYEKLHGYMVCEPRYLQLPTIKTMFVSSSLGEVYASGVGVVDVTPWTADCRTCASGRSLCAELPACFERHPAPAAAAPHSQPAHSGGFTKTFLGQGFGRGWQLLDPRPRVCNCYQLQLCVCLGVGGVTRFDTVTHILDACGLTVLQPLLALCCRFLSLDSASDPSTSDSWLGRRCNVVA